MNLNSQTLRIRTPLAELALQFVLAVLCAPALGADAKKNPSTPAEEAAAQAAQEKARRAVVTKPAGSGADETIKLSPFEVTADNKGYYAPNTLSGTRMDSKLEDLAASISVVTKQQMVDLSTTSIGEMFLYEASTEGPGNFTDVSLDRNGTPQDATASGGPGTRVRGLGTPNISYNGFTSVSNSLIPPDSYNIDAVEISRGPNSNIFGVGNVAGGVNIVGAQARLGRTSSSFSLLTDDRGRFRSSIDLNRPLGQALAFRFLAAYDDKKFQQKPSSEVTRRAQGVVTFQPFRRTTIRGGFEAYHGFSRRPNQVTPTDYISYWIDSGRPTWDPATLTVKTNGVSKQLAALDDALLPAGLQINDLPIQPVRFIDQGRVGLWTVGQLGRTANPNAIVAGDNIGFVETGSFVGRNSARLPLFQRPGISDPALLDWGAINVTSPNYSWNKAEVFQAELEQFVFSTPVQVLAFRLGWRREDGDRYNHVYFSGGQNSMQNQVRVDVNEKLLDGTPNPYFLRPYLRSFQTIANASPNVNDIGRAQVAYQLDLTQKKNLLSWLGRHRVSGYGEMREISNEYREFAERVVSDHAWLYNNPNVKNRFASAGAGGNVSVAQYYLGDNRGQNIEYGPAAAFNQTGPQNFYWRNGATGAWLTEPAVWGEIPSTNSAGSRRELRTLGLTTQDFFFGERIVTSFGWRNDRNRTKATIGFTKLDNQTGLHAFTPDTFPVLWTERRGGTKTQGVVVRPLRGLGFLERRAEAGGPVGQLAEAAASLGVHYNKSDSFQPTAAGYNILNEELPDPFGKGKDYGFSFSALRGNLYFKFNQYETRTLKNRNGNTSSLAGRFRNYDFLDATGFTSVQTFATRTINARPGANLLTPAQLNAEVAKFMGVEESLFVLKGSRAETDDALSRGLEMELYYNPTRHWRLKMNATKQEAINSNLSDGMHRYIALRQPVWTTIKNDQGVSWFETSGVKTSYTDNLAAVALTLAQQGKPRAQVRAWRFNATTSHDFAGIAGERKWLGNLTLGGSVRWEDKGAIGFFGATPEADGVVRSLDVNKPIWSSANTYVDAFARYHLRLAKNKIRASIQLNVRDVFENGGLRVIGANPDGTPYSFRILEPRLFMLTTTFDL